MTVVFDIATRQSSGGSSGPSGAPSPKPAPKPAGGGGGDQPLYKKREPIHPKLAHGPFRTLKWAVLILTLGIYYLTPWLRWDRPGAAPDQAVLIDFEGRRFYFFFLQLWAQEVYFVIGLLVMSALALFLVTALFGRLWCGYACPQTVWTDLYIAVERLFEGDRNARLKLAKAPLSFDKAWRKTGKHLAWLLIAAATGGAWIFYYHDAPTLWSQLWTGDAPSSSYVFLGLLTFTTYTLAGTMREQVCTYMCPWPRIQGAMLDEHSLQVTYRYDRGEPRGPHKKGASWEGRGDCIDCNQCVVVCPMGIDIRNGPQLECINCGLCIDACDETMKKVGRPTGLIFYDTDAAVSARSCGRKASYKPVRGRTLYYATALAIVSVVMAVGLSGRTALELNVLRDRNPMFVTLKDGSIRNGYTVKIANKTLESRDYALGFEGPSGATVRVVGVEAGEVEAFPVAPNGVRSLRVFVTAPATTALESSEPARFTVTDVKSGEATTVATVFLSEGEDR